MPDSVSVPEMDVTREPDVYRQWTRQPGTDDFLHTVVVGASGFQFRFPYSEATKAERAVEVPIARTGGGNVVKLRDYQEAAIQAIVDAWNSGAKAPLIVMPTASGKTLVAAELMARSFAATRRKCLFVAQREELLSQTIDKIRLVSPITRVGLVQAKNNEVGREITVASIQTIGHKSGTRLQKLIENGPYGMLIVDECFPSGTLVGDRPIETIKAGDLVPSFDEETGTYCERAVTATMRRIAPQTMVRIEAGEAHVIATETHPFFTRRGWVRAGDVDCGEEVYISLRQVRPSVGEATVATSQRSSLRGMQADRNGRTVEAVDGPVCAVWEAGRAGEEVALGTGAAGAGCEEESLFVWARVDRVEVCQQTGLRGHDALCPDGHVYNLEVDQTHTYIANGFVVHNCHHAVSPQHVRVIAALREANPGLLVMGMTATPGREDGIALDRVFDVVAYERNTVDMIRDGWLVPPKIFSQKIDVDLDKVATDGRDYVGTQLSKVMNTPYVNRAVVEAWRKYGMDRKSLVFCCDVAHARAIAQEFLDAGYPAAHVDGTMKKKDRKKVLDDFREGKIKLLANCFDSETEILTKRGWLRGDAVRIGDMSAAVTLDGAVAWEPVTHVVRRSRASGERMMTIKNQRLDIRVTEGHRMVFAESHLMRWKVAEASELLLKRATKATWLRLAGTEDVPGLGLSESEAEFLGLFYSDGHLASGSRGIQIASANSYRLTLQPEIERILTGCGFDWRRSERSDGTAAVYRIPVGSIGGQLRRSGFHRLRLLLSGDKILPSEMLRMNVSEFAGFVRGMWLGDGTKFWRRPPRRARSYEISNTNKALLDQIQALAVTRGFAANIRGPRDNGNAEDGTPHAPLYVICIRQRDWCVTNVEKKRSFDVEEWGDDRHEEVWCVTNQTGTVIVRRNGRPVVTGQCQLLTEGYDDPSAEGIVFARPTQSQALAIQILGRGLRLYPGKTECVVVDCVGNSEKHRPVQLASLSGFDPERRFVGGGLKLDDEDEGDIEPEEELPEVIDARLGEGREVAFSARAKRSNYQWRETSVGWILQIPRIGYYLVAWSDKAHHMATIRFYDQRKGRRDDPAREVVRQPVDFEMAYGLVEGEMDRMFRAATSRRSLPEEDDTPPIAAFVDLDEGVEEDMTEEYMLKDAGWRKNPITTSQRDALLKHGFKEKSLPETAGEASDMISIVRAERDMKMRLPATAKQIGYLRVHGLPVGEGMTKGKAASIIWKHRRDHG